MRIVNLIINDNKISILTEKELSSGTYKNDMCHFSFSDEWNELKDKFAVFVTKDDAYVKSIVDNECEIPSEISHNAIRFGIGVYAQIINDEKQIERRDTSNLVYINYYEGAYREGLKESEALSEVSMYETYISKMNKIYTNIKEEHKETIEDIENKEIDVKRNIDEYAVEKIKEYDNNSNNRIKEYDDNVKLKKEEIDKIAEEVKKDKTDIEEIEKRVKTSESNAKTSETNSKTSEQNAQKSAEDASEILTNITTIQEDINTSKAHIDEQKEKVDKSVQDAEKLVDEATNQANISKEQADISTTNAGRTSADKAEVETMKDEVSTMKTSVEQTKSDTEQIKTDTQVIYNNTVDAKNETLQAKEEVENSLENERIESDKRYAKAIESDEIVIEEFGQVELDEDGYMKDFSAEGNLPEITQDKREGYNLINADYNFPYTENDVTVTKNEDGSITLNGTNSANKNFIFSKYFDITNLIGKTLTLSVKTTGVGILNNIGLKRYYADNIFVLEKIENSMESYSTIENFNPKYTTSIGVAAWILAGTVFKDFTIYLTLVEGTEEKPYEKYGASPSLDYSSPFKNVIRNVDISNNGKNFFNYINKFTSSSGGLKNTINSDGSITTKGKLTTSYAPIVDNIDITNLLENGETYTLSQKKTSLYVYAQINMVNRETGKAEFLSINSSNTNSKSITVDFSKYSKYTIRVQANTTAVWGDEEREITNLYQLEKGDKATDFEPYKGYKTELELSEGQIIGTLGTSKNIIENNTLKKNIEYINLKNVQGWAFDATNGRVYTAETKGKRLSSNNVKSTILCTHLISKSLNDLLNEEDSAIAMSAIGYLSVKIKEFTTKQEYIDFFNENDIYIVYELQDEENVNLSTENQSIINSLKTYKGINNIASKDCKVSFKVNRDIKKVIEENTLKERKISDQKYARALKGKVVDEKNVQIYAGNKNVDDLVLKGNKITQETREGYNMYDGVPSEINKRLSTSGTGSYSEEGYSITKPISVKANATYTIVSGIYSYVCLYNSQKQYIRGFGLANKGTVTPTEDGFIKFDFKSDNDEVMIYDGTEEKPYEEYGVSPSLDYSSEIEVTTEQNIHISKENILDVINNFKQRSSSRGLTYEVINDGSFKVDGTSTGYSGVYSIGDYSSDRKIAKLFKNHKYRFYLQAQNTNNKVVRAYFGKTNKNDFDVSCFNDGIQYKDYTMLEDYMINQFSIIGGTTNDVRENLIIKVWIVDITEGIPENEEYKQYQGNKYNVMLSEGQFNNSLGNNHNYITKINNKWNLVNTIKKITIQELKNMYFSNDDNGEFVLIGTGLQNSSREYIGATSPVFCNVLQAFKNISFETSKEMISIFRHASANQLRINLSKKRLDKYEGTTYSNKFKSMLDDMIEKGLNFDIYYPLAEANYEYIELSEEIQQVLNSIELMDDLNIMSIDNGTFSFEYNKSLMRTIEEKDKEILDLKEKLNQIIARILALESGTNQASEENTNINEDNEIENV